MLRREKPAVALEKCDTEEGSAMICYYVLSHTLLMTTKGWKNLPQTKTQILGFLCVYETQHAQIYLMFLNDLQRTLVCRVPHVLSGFYFRLLRRLR